MTPAAAELVRTAEDALAAGDVERAVEVATAALELGETPDARRLLGWLCFLDDRFTAARQHFEAAFRSFRSQGQEREAARTAIDLAMLHINMLGQDAAARGWSERARHLLARVGPCAEWGYLELVTLACERPDVEDLLASTERALTIALEFADSDLEAQAMADGGLALVSQGRATEGFARLDAALAAISAGEVSARIAGLCFCSMLTACDRAGDLHRAEQWTTIVSDRLDATGNRPRALHTHCRMAYGSVLSAAGRWQEAEELMVEALGPADAPNVAHRALTSAHLAELRLEQGRIEDAAELLAPFEDHVTSCAPLARVYELRGDLDLAAAVLRRGINELVGDVLRAAPLLTALVQVELRRGALEAARVAAAELARMAATVDIAVVGADATVADGRVLMANGDLPAAVAAFESAKRRLGGAERPLQLGMVRLELAEALADHGDATDAVVEARAALACFERLGATLARDRTAALLRRLGASGRIRPADVRQAAATLSPRESEVLELVRQGLTNAEIGARLFISAKTAEHHVGRVLTKLGVRSRAEAAALAVRLEADAEK